MQRWAPSDSGKGDCERRSTHRHIHMPSIALFGTAYVTPRRPIRSSPASTVMLVLTRVNSARRKVTQRMVERKRNGSRAASD